MSLKYQSGLNSNKNFFDMFFEPDMLIPKTVASTLYKKHITKYSDVEYLPKLYF